MSGLVINGITKRYGGNTVLNGLTAALPGGIMCIYGASGCGKTTLAMIVAGIVKPDRGSIEGIVGNVTVMFQEPRLFPAFSALENVACVTKNGSDKASELLHTLGLTDEDIKKKPSELSGGMNQRVALARAVLFFEIKGGNTVILDEPFKGLDPVSKEAAAKLVKSRITADNLLVITHDFSDIELLNGAAIDFSTMKCSV